MEEMSDTIYYSCYCATEDISITQKQCEKIEKTLCKKQQDEISQTDFILQVVLILVIGFFGVCGNIGAIHRFSRLKRATKFHHLMMLISMYDLLCISMIVSIFSIPHISDAYKASAFYNYFAPIALSLTQVALTGSIYTTLAITIERYLIVCHPFYVVSQDWTSKMYILPIAIFSILYNIPKFLELYALPCYLTEINETTTISDNNNTQELNKIKLSNFSSSCFEEEKFDASREGHNELSRYFILPTNLRLDAKYYSFYGIWMNLIFMGTLPVITLIILNILILKNLIANLKAKEETSIPTRPMIRKSISLGNQSCPASIKMNQYEFTLSTKKKKMKPKEIKLAKVGLYIVLIFVLCHSVRWVPNFYELTHPGADEPYWVTIFMHLSHFVLVFNSSVNFYVYCLTHLDIVKNIKQCFSKKTNYMRSKYESASQSTARRMSALTSLQIRKSSLSSLATSEQQQAHKTRLQSIMEGMKESVTMPMLSTVTQTDESDDDDEW